MQADSIRPAIAVGVVELHVAILPVADRANDKCPGRLFAERHIATAWARKPSHRFLKEYAFECRMQVCAAICQGKCQSHDHGTEGQFDSDVTSGMVRTVLSRCSILAMEFSNLAILASADCI